MMRSSTVAVLIATLFCSVPVGAEGIRLPPRVAEQVSLIKAMAPERDDRVFAKMGGSSVASRAFLACFSAPFVRLGADEVLQGTVGYFGETERGFSPFSRKSSAANVGWSLRQALSGDPPALLAEVKQTNARYALLLFGGNDAMSENERVFARRLDRAIQLLLAEGVVPILGSVTPRRNSGKDLWIQRFNVVANAMADVWSLPYVDYYAAMNSLPAQGLARDGVHPNVRGKGGYSNACVFDDNGLLFGQNVRNLLTLKMLDALKSQPPAALLGAQTERPRRRVSAEHAETLQELPSSTWIQLQADFDPVEAELSCGRRVIAHSYLAKLNVADRAKIRASAFGMNGRKPRVALVEVNEDGSRRCLRTRIQTVEKWLSAGDYEVWIQPSKRSLMREDGILFVVDRKR